jgi:hypothetical protein
MTAQMKGQDATTLLPDHTSQRKLPMNLRPEDLQLFQRELTRTIPSVELRELQNIRISSEGLLIERGRILDESFAFPFLRKDWKKRAVAKAMAQNYLTRRSRWIDDEVIWITDLWSPGYFHWIADALCKLELVSDLLRDRLLLLPHDLEHLDFVRQSLEAFPVENIQFIGANEVVRCARVWRPTPVAPSGHFREEVILAVRRRLLDRFVSSAANQNANRVYISRRRAPKRRVANEAEVLAVLRDFEIDVVEMESLSFSGAKQTRRTIAISRCRPLWA